jgi:D-glycero-D-manno-heptose 1,7-bisphosphate phosphatase
MTQRRFVVLDRDGTINEERHYLSDPAQVELIPGAADGMRRLQQLGLGLVVVTNQSAIGRGFFDWQQLDLIHTRLRDLLAIERVNIDAFFVCPHRPEDNCACRKPKPLLIELAAKELDFDPQASFVIGDKPCDVDIGRAVGATTLLVRTGYGAQFASEATVAADFVVDDLTHAADVILPLLEADANHLCKQTVMSSAETQRLT